MSLDRYMKVDLGPMNMSEYSWMQIPIKNMELVDLNMLFFQPLSYYKWGLKKTPICS